MYPVAIVASCHRIWRKRSDPDTAETHYRTTRQLYQQLRAAKDLERSDREWEEE
jgi:hypothetical protein